MKSWLQKCAVQHGFTCKSDIPRQSELTVRLINVGIENSNLQDMASYLIDVESLPNISGEPLHYAALSYCWRQDGIPFKTSTLNLNGLKCHDQWPQPIPKTIADAITMTRVPVLQYLWIDALCIVQDDRKDFETEIAKMASIYRNAYVTIVAANATSSTEGFIHPRSTDHFRSIIFHSRLHPGVHGLLYLRIPEHSQRSSEPRQSWETIEKSVWNSRGWTFQERHLSNRSLYFGPAAVHFLCNAHYFCETHTGEFSRQHHWLPKITTSLQYPSYKHLGAESSGNLAKLTDVIHEA